jgi:hypothetical protein
VWHTQKEIVPHPKPLRSDAQSRESHLVAS